MSAKLVPGDLVNIKVGDESGGWGTVVKESHPYYHVAMYRTSTESGTWDERVFDRSEISKPRAKGSK